MKFFFSEVCFIGRHPAEKIKCSEFQPGTGEDQIVNRHAEG